MIGRCIIKITKPKKMSYYNALDIENLILQILFQI